MRFGIKEFKYYIKKYKDFINIYPFEYYAKKVEEFTGKAPNSMIVPEDTNMWLEYFEAWGWIQKFNAPIMLPELVFPHLIFFREQETFGEINEVQ